ncbi:MAG: potassium transporter [Gammaproteobacteria bacterium]|nr:potassium transporter [Gammaproteobacteria bacterium]
MQWPVIRRIIGVLIALFSFLQLVPMAVGVYYQDDGRWVFAFSFLLIFLVGLAIWWPVRKSSGSLRIRDGYVVVTAFWVGLGVTGAVPFLLEPSSDLSVMGAVFESISGLTTTGATVIVGLDELPKSLLFYRQWLQWFGGMGIIVLAVAVLPLLGIGGMQLYRAETPGPQKDSKLTPRIAQTAKMLWAIYVGLTVLCASAYWWAGMTPFDAIGHAFSTVAIGGFSTHDASIGFFDNHLIESVAVVFMLISGLNFTLHYVAIRHLQFKQYWMDEEARFYLLVLAFVGLVTVLHLYISTNLSGERAFFHGIFQTVSIATTTGFTTAEYFYWPGVLPILLLFTSFVGGCSGSTGGGMKVIRVLLLFKQGLRELTRVVHPQARVQIKIGDRPLPQRLSEAVWGFFAAYVALFITLMLLLIATGEQPLTAFSAVAACINNLGPGLEDVGANYASVSDVGLLILTYAMLLGRLEIFTLLLLFTPVFWRK